MKIEQGSSFQKLIAGKVETPRREPPPVPEKKVEEAASNNEEAASTISRVAADSQSSQRAEVERSVQEASRARPEEVDSLAEEVATKIRDNPEQAVAAQANQANRTVQRLLQ
jgi:hypothetical protein